MAGDGLAHGAQGDGPGQRLADTIADQRFPSNTQWLQISFSSPFPPLRFRFPLRFLLRS